MMRRVIRDRQLTADEAAKYRDVRKKIEEELPSLIERHHDRTTALERLELLFPKLRAAREERGLSLLDVQQLIGCDAVEVLRLEAGEPDNPRVKLLIRYAEAVGKRLILELADA